MHGEEGDDAAYDLGTADHQRPDGMPTKATARGAIDRFTIWPTVRLTIPERGLYTGVAIFGAVGSGKTSACMHPFARQLLSWQATNPERRAAALVLEVRGDSCHDIRRMLTELDRGEDYIELSLDGRLTWNPLSATWLDSYSLSTARARDPAPSAPPALGPVARRVQLASGYHLSHKKSGPRRLVRVRSMVGGHDGYEETASFPLNRQRHQLPVAAGKT